MSRRYKNSNFDSATSGQVWRAISSLRNKLPAMVKFARIITGNDKLTIEITTGVPRTLGNKVYIRPPLGLGSNEEHERSKCGVRGDTGKQECKACQLREVIDFYLFHELAHVIGQTQKLVTKAQIKKARLEALRLHPEGCPHHRDVVDRLDHVAAVGSDSMTLGSIVSPWLPMMINALEDCRVNEMTFSTRPGMRTIFNMNTERLLSEGSEVLGGELDERQAWIDAPSDQQFIVGLMISGSGNAFVGNFSPDVMEALADPKLQYLCAQAIHAVDVFEIFSLSLDVSKRAQELGFCKLDPCVIEEESPDSGDDGTPDGQDSDAGAPDEEHGDTGEGGGGEGSGSGGKEGGGTSEGNEDDQSLGSGDSDSSDENASQGSDRESASQEESSAREETSSGDSGDAGEASPGEGGTGESSGTGNGSEGRDEGLSDVPEGAGSSETGVGTESGSELDKDNSASSDAKSDPVDDQDTGDNAGSEGSTGGSGNEADGQSGDGSNNTGTGEGDAELRDGVQPLDSEDAESGGVDDARSRGGNDPSSGDDEVADGSANTPDNAGISGPDSQEGAATRSESSDPTRNAHGDSDPDVRELESSVRNEGQEQVVRDQQDVSHESAGGQESGDTAGHEGDRPDSSESGEDDAEERAEGSAKQEGQDDQTVEPTNPWDVSNVEHVDHEGTAFDGPSVHVDDQTPTVAVPSTPEDAARALSRFLMHGMDESSGLLDDMATLEDEDANHGNLEQLIGIPQHNQEYDKIVETLIGLAMVQVDLFDAPSENVVATQIARFPMRGIRWHPDDTWERQGFTEDQLTTAFAPSEQTIGKALLHASAVFDANKRSHLDRNRKSGRINTRVLGRRAPVQDPRLFAKKVIPKKKDYFVVLGGDASGSTEQYERNAKIKRCMHAQAEVLHRLHVPWAGYMHSAYWSSLDNFNPAGGRERGPDGQVLIWNYLLPFKEVRDQWNDEAKYKLASINPVSQNLDGHTIEAYRKIAMQSTATDRIIIYYTDGEMPAANKTEEKEILIREIEICKRMGIHLMGVGIQTDSPTQYGLETVRVDSDEDIIKVIQFLEKILTR